MLQAIKQFFEERVSPEGDHNAQDKTQLACAALLIEVMRADRSIDPAEQTALLYLLEQQFGLSDKDIKTLVLLAEQEADEATSLFQFTQLINAHYAYEQKVAVIRALWTIAFADQLLDKYEEQLIRKIADLLHIRHRDFIRSKQETRDAAIGCMPEGKN